MPQPSALPRVSYPLVTRRSFANAPDDATALMFDGLDEGAFDGLARFSALREVFLVNCPVTARTVAGLAALPALRGLVVSGLSEDADALAAMVASRPIETLSLSLSAQQGGAFETIARSTTLRHFSFNGGSVLTAAQLAALRRVATLEGLTLYGVSALTDDVVAALAEMPRLAWLELCGTSALRGESLGSLRALRGLSVFGENLGENLAAGLGALAKLEHLGVGHVSARERETLAALPSLCSLHLWSAHRATVDELAGLAELPRLAHLDLSNCPQLTDEMLAALAARRALRTLRVEQCRGLRGAALLDASLWGELEELSVAHTDVDDAVMASVATFPKLTRLDVTNTPNASAAGLRRLADAPALRTLVAHASALDDDAVLLLGPRLDELVLHSCGHVTARSVGALAREHPRVRVLGEGHLRGGQSLEPVSKFSGGSSHPPVLASGGGVVALSDYAGATTLYDCATGKRRGKKTLAAKAGLALDPKGALALVVGPKARLVDTATGAAVDAPAFKLLRPDSAVFSPDGKLAAMAGHGGTVKKPAMSLRAWGVGATDLLAQIDVPGECPEAVHAVFSSDNASALLFGPRLAVVDLRTGKARALCDEPVACAAFGDDGAVHYAIGGTFRTVDAATGAARAELDLGTMLRDAPTLVVRAELDVIVDDPERTPSLDEPRVTALVPRPRGLCILVDSGGGALGVVDGSRALWLCGDNYTKPAVATNGSALSAAYQRIRPGHYEYAAGVWDLDALFAMIDPR